MNLSTCINMHKKDLIRLTFRIGTPDKLCTDRNCRKTEICRDSENFIEPFTMTVDTFNKMITVRNSYRNCTPARIGKCTDCCGQFSEADLNAFSIKIMIFRHSQDLFYSHHALKHPPFICQ